MPLLDVQDLTVEFPTRRGLLRALDDERGRQVNGFATFQNERRAGF